MPKPTARTHACPTCGARVTGTPPPAWRADGRFELRPHTRPGTSDPCPASGALVKEPRPESPSRGRGPKRIPYRCPTCGAQTAVLRGTGRLREHRQPGGIRVCSLSGYPLMRPDASEVGRELPWRLVKSAAATPPDSTYHLRGDEPSTSVRAARGGLPTLGKRG